MSCTDPAEQRAPAFTSGLVSVTRINKKWWMDEKRWMKISLAVLSLMEMWMRCTEESQVVCCCHGCFTTTRESPPDRMFTCVDGNDCVQRRCEWQLHRHRHFFSLFMPVLTAMLERRRRRCSSLSAASARLRVTSPRVTSNRRPDARAHCASNTHQHTRSAICRCLSLVRRNTN